MSEVGKITIIAKNIKGNASGQVRYDGKKISNTSGGTFTQNGIGNGVFYGNSEKRKATIKPTDFTYKVKAIELLTSLDEGSSNDKSGGTQKGMVFGKTYMFKVKSYVDKEPQNKLVINWMFKYHNLSKNRWEEIYLNAKGEVLKLLVNEKEMCGRYVYISAYINDPKTEGELKIWKHNRFRWFDRMIVEDEIEDRTTKGMPWKINQAGTSLCGMACIFYLFAKEKPFDYKKFAKQLFRTGEASFSSYTAQPSKELTEKRVSTNGFPLKTGNMPLVDFVTLAGTRNTNNSSYKGGSEQFQAINWPPLMIDLCKKLLGYKSVSSKGVHNPVAPLIYTSYDIKMIIEDINKQFNAGYKLIFMIDSDLIDDVWDFKSLDLHWVALESEIKTVNMLNEEGKIVEMLDFRLYSWGTNPNNDIPLVLDNKSGKMIENSEHRYLKRPITKAHFMNNFNGYIKIK